MTGEKRADLDGGAPPGDHSRMTTATIRTASFSFPRQLALAFGGSLFIAACAQIAVPMWPAPMTMQTFAVMLVGAALGSRLGLAAVALYLLEGAAGLPVFAHLTGGAPVIVGPTAGYLLAFLPAVWLVGFASDRGLGRHPLLIAGPMALATGLILAPGGLWMGAMFGVDWFAYGVAPFVLGGALKVALAALLAPRAKDVLMSLRA